MLFCAFNLHKKTMEKLTETINAVKVSKSVKDALIKIAETEELQIQQVVRRLLKKAINDYYKIDL